MEEVEEAALKARKKDIAEMLTDARIETAKKLVQLAKKKAWISDSEFKKMATPLKKKEPLPKPQLESIKARMKSKTLSN